MISEIYIWQILIKWICKYLREPIFWFIWSFINPISKLPLLNLNCRCCFKTASSANKAFPLSGKKRLKWLTTSSRLSLILAMFMSTRFFRLSTSIFETISWPSPKRSLKSVMMMLSTSMPMTTLKYSLELHGTFARRVCLPHCLGGMMSVLTVSPHFKTSGQI